MENIEETFIDKNKFSQLVERHALENDESMIDSILHICENLTIDVEDVPKLISKSLLQKLEHEAINLRLLVTKIHTNTVNSLYSDD